MQKATNLQMTVHNVSPLIWLYHNGMDVMKGSGMYQNHGWLTCSPEYNIKTWINVFQENVLEKKWIPLT
jgi:hypothetical protein